MKKSIFLFILGIALLAGCSKAPNTTYCYKCAEIQYGSQGGLIDTVNICGPGYGSQYLVYQKGDSFIYQFGVPSYDTTRCLRYAQ